MTLRLYWHPFSIFPRRVRIALREKAVTFEEIEVDLPGGATRSASFRQLNPFGQLPVLEHDGVVIYESVAILEYLEERYPNPPLMPHDLAARARVRQWTQASGSYLAGPLKRWVARLFTPEEMWNRDDQALAAREIGAHLDALDLTLADAGDYLVGSFSLADIAYAPLVCELAAVGLGEQLGGRPAVGAWIERLRGRSSIRDTAPA